MMGYGQVAQKVRGIHLRLRARAFVFAEANSSVRMAFVSADLWSCTEVLKAEVVKQLKQTGYDCYSRENVMIVGTHTHAGPGGYSGHALYNFSVLGFQRRNFACIADGIVSAILRAHVNVGPGRVAYHCGSLRGVSTNRSPEAYSRNSEEERQLYDTNVDDSFHLLRLDADTESPRSLGLISWFAVHPTSMDMSNDLISGDNKGAASYIVERSVLKVDYRAPNHFVAAFAQGGSVGDVSPNAGPNGFGSNLTRTLHSAWRQAESARCLWEKAVPTGNFSAKLWFRHTYVDFHKVCVPAAVGAAFGAGSQMDGPSGVPGLVEGQKGSAGPLYEALREMLTKTTRELREAHHPKPILLASGVMSPSWTPHVLPLQLFAFCEETPTLVIAAVPFELSTMAGRRLRKALEAVLECSVILTGPANAYAGYCVTFEEYQEQKYEGAHTLFGPHTLIALIGEMQQLAQSLQSDTASPPPDLVASQWNFQSGVVADLPIMGCSFGDTMTDASQAYFHGDVVNVRFCGGHPKNNVKTQTTFLEVQRHIDAETWETVADDGDWCTTFRWRRKGVAASIVEISWSSSSATPGLYRIVHTGHVRNMLGVVTPYRGQSRAFIVRSTPLHGKL